MADADRARHRVGARRRAGGSTGVLRLWIALVLAAITCAAVVVVLVAGHGRGATASASGTRSEREVRRLLAGIPQRGNTLGRPTAPVTLQVFSDLECLTAKRWVLHLLPSIIRQFVRPGIVKLQYRSLKTDTHSAAVFVNQQAAALAAGQQDKMWTFVETFYHEQGKEYTPYVTERYLDGIARQVSGLNLGRWHAERATGTLSAQVVGDDEAARSAGMHDTPGFMIGRTGGKLEGFSGRVIFLEFPGFGKMKYPVSLITAEDLGKAVRGLG